MARRWLSKALLIPVVVTAFTVSALTVPAGPAEAKPRGSVVWEWIGNDSPATEKCATSGVHVYNASNAPVYKLRVLWYGSLKAPDGDWAPIRKTKAKSWKTYHVYLRPGKSMTIWDYVCAYKRAPKDPEFGFRLPMAAKAKYMRWYW